MELPILIFTLLLSLVLSSLTISYARRLSIVDIANHRSSHAGVTPRGGGISFVLVFYIGGVTSSFLLTGAFTTPLIVILVSSLILAGIGWLDDFKDLSVGVRFGVQIGVVLFSVLFLPRTWGFMPIFIEKTIIAFGWVWFINLFNFMDGTDGYAIQEAFFICLGLFILGISIGNIALILGFSVLGFLRVNYPKAKIFMGDVGSIFLGYILGGLIIYSVTLKELSIFQSVMLTSLFLFDATYTLIKRGLQGKKVWKAHREHWYQRLNISGTTHKTIFYIGAIYNLLLLSLLVLNRNAYLEMKYLVIIAVVLLILIALYIKNKEKQFNHTAQTKKC